mmetsp:Transcript_6974/g.13943  ORF Transcript_6974/g.13943 Transcript_6974/m.13943 type:complete len:126 (-) Transcript_6974:1156-1533(-)|eukprot:CAMPEP_0171519110 /NCGR_PEP_ID=MMETSP0959-20130129/5687_1 /TAXON_ID=87120 /ORGANISM="Aurantiochytrium limacinum, Strain ATCCMYA-1381" /LENGTH=125 /DNA_ID=CAMNT_0012058449 /DNA_START=22 /DNA_END=399 /DNA_ORIENTATION=+
MDVANERWSPSGSEDFELLREEANLLLGQATVQGALQEYEQASGGEAEQAQEHSVSSDDNLSGFGGTDTSASLPASSSALRLAQKINLLLPRLSGQDVNALLGLLRSRETLVVKMLEELGEPDAS